MSALWPSARAIGRRGSCLTNTPAFLRNAATAAKPRVQKTASSAGENTAKTAKPALSTKPRASTTAKPQKKKVEFPAPPVPATKPTPTFTATKPTPTIQASRPTPTIQAAKPAPTIQATKPTPTIQAAKPTPTIQATKPTPTPFTKTTPAAKNAEVRGEAKTQPAQTTATEAPAGATVSPQAPHVGAWKPTGKPREPVKKPVDVNGPEYKSAARKWTAVIVALPMLIVTSYYLYDRLALGNGPGLFDPAPTPPLPAPKDKTLDA